MRKGSHHSPETRAKIGVALLVNQNGANPTNETRANMSVAHMGHKVSQETRAKLRAGRLGKVASGETRAKLSVAHMGNKPSTETMAKLMGNTNGRGPNYRAHRLHYARVYEGVWGPLSVEECGKAYAVHHRDGNRQNDDPDNLIALTNSEHAILEHALRRGDWDLASEVDAIGESRRQT